MALFDGLSVVEFASVLAGPAVGTFFSELGADVTKIENKTTGGDVTRQWREHGEEAEGPSAYYASVNWNKDPVFLDLTNADDLEEAYRFVREADIVITNFKRGDAEKFGLTYEQISEINSSIVYGHITGFSNENDRLAYDLIMQAETGFMSMNGQANSPPTKMPLALIDVLAAHQLKEGLLCALLKQKDHPDQSYYVEASLYDSAVASLINQATNWLMNGNIPRRRGSLHPNIAPYGEIFSTADGKQVTVAIGSNRQFVDLCAVLGFPEMAEQEQYSTNAKRVANRALLEKIIEEKVSSMQSAEFLDACRERLVPAAEIKDLKQVFESEQAQKLLLKERMENRETIRPRTTIFKLRS